MSNKELLVSLEAEISGIQKVGAKCKLVGSHPKPIFVIEWKDRWTGGNLSIALLILELGISRLHSGRKTCGLIRCVEIDRLLHILQHGCDVFPTDSVLWVDKSPSKALEYGGDEKVMMVFDCDSTHASYVEVDSNIDRQRFNEIRAVYPTVVHLDNGSRIWFTRLAENNPRVASPYETEHGRWIPGDPFDALSGLIVLGRNLDDMTNTVRSAMTTCSHPRWV